MFQDLWQRLELGEPIAVVGLGYVGFPLATLLAKKFKVIGFDNSEDRIKLFQKGIDPTNEVGTVDPAITFTSDPSDLAQCSVAIVCVPTPTNTDHTPDLRPLQSATATVGYHIKKPAVMIYESTVYPGVTEGLKDSLMTTAPQFFKFAYSPERINPGDKKNTVKTITKLVSGEDDETLKFVSALYNEICESVHECASIKVAEMAKLFENTQRDANIAIVNELTKVCNGIGIDPGHVLSACETKWNFGRYKPGLVGGHCLAEDPYYYIEVAKKVGVEVPIIEATRQTNFEMPSRIAHRVLEQIELTGRPCKVAIFGAAYKADVNDLRNNGGAEIFKVLNKYKACDEVYIEDPYVDPAYFKKTYGFDLTPFAQIPNDLDVAIVTTRHTVYEDLLRPDRLVNSMKADGLKLFVDLTGLPFTRRALNFNGLTKMGF